MNDGAEPGQGHLRVARLSRDLAAAVRFYRDGLGLEVLYEFKDHDGFDGVMLGHEGAAYHLEFTRKRDHKAGRAATEENLLVFYLPDAADWVLGAVRRLNKVSNDEVEAGVSIIADRIVPITVHAKRAP